MPVLPGNEQDFGHENIANTYMFYQVCKVHDIVLETSLPMQRSHDHDTSFRHFCQKLVSWMVTASLPNQFQIFAKSLTKIELRHYHAKYCHQSSYKYYPKSDLFSGEVKNFSGSKGPFILDDNDALFSIFFVVRNDKKKWVAWLPMIPFTLDDKKIMSLLSGVKWP